jgi:hypothetical protein
VALAGASRPSGRIHQSGLGRKNQPFVYWLDGKEERKNGDGDQASDAEVIDSENGLSAERLTNCGETKA